MLSIILKTCFFEGHDEVNKETMTPEEIDAVDSCVDYILYTIFAGRDDFKSFVKLIKE